MSIRDTLERLLWTVVAAFLGGLSVGGVLDISTLDAAILAAGTAAVNFVLIVARWRLSVLPEPGDGLPGIPVERVSARDRLAELGMHDDLPTTGAPEDVA